MLRSLCIMCTELIFKVKQIICQFFFTKVFPRLIPYFTIIYVSILIIDLKINKAKLTTKAYLYIIYILSFIWLSGTKNINNKMIYLGRKTSIIKWSGSTFLKDVTQIYTRQLKNLKTGILFFFGVFNPFFSFSYEL